MEKLKDYQLSILNNIMKNMGLARNNHTFTTNILNIFNYITEGSDYSTTTKRDYLIIVCKTLEHLKYYEIRDQIYKAVKIYAKEHNDTEHLQTLDENERDNYVEYDELYEKVNILLDEYNDSSSLKSIRKLVILALYVLQPPLRNDYYNMKIIYNNDDNDNKNNFLLVTDDYTNMDIIINQDKVINLHGPIYIPIENSLLLRILKTYIKFYMKDAIYLFENPNHTPYKKHQIKYIINKMFIHKVLTIYNLRSAYITNFYNNHLDLKSRGNLAKYMRHSTGIAELSYYKILNN
jgi:hypothetical protein